MVAMGSGWPVVRLDDRFPRRALEPMEQVLEGGARVHTFGESPIHDHLTSRRALLAVLEMILGHSLASPPVLGHAGAQFLPQFHA